jgi:hypothetical protein
VGAAEALGGSIRNRLNDTLRILAQFTVPEAQDGPAFLPQEGVAAEVASAVHVLAAVEFDDQPRVTAGEVGPIGSWRVNLGR